MSRKYLNDKWCVRCGRKTPCPYLIKNLKLLPNGGKVLDIGCGNGRNSIFMSNEGYDVTSVDMADDFGIKLILGKDKLPKGKFDIILANYIFMFLDGEERKQLFEQINKHSKKGTVMMVELYPAKDAFEVSIDEVVGNFLEWSKIRKSKDKCVIVKD